MTTEEKVKSYQDCLDQMEEEINKAKIAKQEATEKLDILKSKQESKNNEVNESSSKLGKAQRELDTAKNSQQSFREKRQATLLSGKDHTDITKKLKENQEKIELLEETVIPLKSQMESLKKEEEYLKEEVLEAENLLQDTINYMEILEACIEYNKAAEIMAPLVKRMLEIAKARGYGKNPFKAIRLYGGSRGFSNDNAIFDNNIFAEIPKIYIGNMHPLALHSPMGQANNFNCWHFHKSKVVE